MSTQKVDIAELEKQHSELGDMIVKLGGKIKYPESDDADAKAKKVAKVERVRLDDDDITKAKKKPKASAKDNSDDDEGDDSDDEGEDEDDDMEDETKKSSKVKKVADEDDESLVFKGQTIKKSAVGEVQFGLVKSMSEELEKNSKDIAKAQDEALMAKLEKRADAEYPHVPGSVTDRATMLKTISKMDEKIAKLFEAVFKQSEALAKRAFETVGTSAGGDTEDVKKARSDFEGKVTEIRKRDNCGKVDAMQKARREHPELFKAYQDAQN